MFTDSIMWCKVLTGSCKPPKLHNPDPKSHYPQQTHISCGTIWPKTFFGPHTSSWFHAGMAPCWAHLTRNSAAAEAREAGGGAGKSQVENMSVWCDRRRWLHLTEHSPRICDALACLNKQADPRALGKLDNQWWHLMALRMEMKGRTLQLSTG